MKKRLLATIPVLLVVFLCSSNVFADTFTNGTALNSQTAIVENGVTIGYRNIQITPLKPVLCELEIDSNGGYTITASNNSTTTYGSGHIDNPNTHTTGSYLYYYDGTGTFHWPNYFTVSPDSSSTSKYNVVRYDFLITVNLLNELSNQSIAIDSGNMGFRFVYSLPSGVTDCGHEVSGYMNNIINFQNLTSSAIIYVSVPPDYIYSNKVILPAGARYFGGFVVSVYGTYTGDYNSNYPTVSSINYSAGWASGSTWTGYNPSVPQNLYELNNKFDQFLQAYNSNVSQSQSVTNESSALENTSDTVHQQEQSYYTQTNTALANTGLSNYQFSSDVVGGMGKVKDHFTYVWNKIGNYNVVFVFSLTLSVALMIIRHVRPIRRKQEE